MIEQELRDALEDALDHVGPFAQDLILDIQAIMLTPGQFAALPDTSDGDFYSDGHQDEGQRSEA